MLYPSPSQQRNLNIFWAYDIHHLDYSPGCLKLVCSYNTTILVYSADQSNPSVSWISDIHEPYVTQALAQ